MILTGVQCAIQKQNRHEAPLRRQQEGPICIPNRLSVDYPQRQLSPCNDKQVGVKINAKTEYKMQNSVQNV
jgi:hypothetical protein